MTTQRDMFDGDPFAPDPEPEIPAPARGSDDGDAVAPTPLAVPCGFYDRRNKPCRRLATRPILMDGKPFVHRDRLLLFCPRQCWFDDDSAVEPEPANRIVVHTGYDDEPDLHINPVTDDHDDNFDPDDPGHTQMPDYGDAHDDGDSHDYDP
ncbi:hypothetical protein [Novosphingobium clariflavum]|uniref:Uncharacterized protein n=1 Tax=Novosphingobium clariflavum TaxID=2029884 RepID=A0ABV6SES0_9SPHN|nr:hypothetical protein [Novosphingobium clariflavum]